MLNRVQPARSRVSGNWTSDRKDLREAQHKHHPRKVTRACSRRTRRRWLRKKEVSYQSYVCQSVVVRMYLPAGQEISASAMSSAFSTPAARTLFSVLEGFSTRVACFLVWHNLGHVGRHFEANTSGLVCGDADFVLWSSNPIP